uniref:Inhibitor of growth family, member 5a n=1 Tax=Sinocyclocheilus anshuiensis TaxID=1608454 RepID=A0A671SS42_9TELE
ALTTMYLHQQLTSIENLPCELQRNFTLMRELDNRAEEKKCEIDKLAEEYIRNVRNLAPDQRVEHLQKIQNGFSKCKEYSDNKVQLAMQTYEMVSKPKVLELEGQIKMEEMCFSQFLKMAKDSAARIELGRSFLQEGTYICS